MKLRTVECSVTTHTYRSDMLTKFLLFALALSLHSIVTQSASLFDLGLGALGQLQPHHENGNGNGNGHYENGDEEEYVEEPSEEEEEPEEREVNPFHKLNSMQEGEEFPYLWPKFPFFPGLRFPPNYPEWMLARRPTGIPDIARLGLGGIQLPWGRPENGDDDNDDDENGEDEEEPDIEECPDEGLKFISHPDNCNQYILCMEGDEVAELDCPDDLHFSRDSRSCVEPDEAGCE